MFLRNFDNVCAVCNGVNNNFGDGTFGDNSVICKMVHGKLNTFNASGKNPISLALNSSDSGSFGNYMALSFGSDTDEPTYEDYTYKSVTGSGITRQNATRTTEYDFETEKYTVTLSQDFYNSTDSDIVANTFVLVGDLSYSNSYNFIFYKELLKDENGELAPIIFPAKSYKHIEFKYTVQGHIYKPEGVTAT